MSKLLSRTRKMWFNKKIKKSSMSVIALALYKPIGSRPGLRMSPSCLLLPLSFAEFSLAPFQNKSWKVHREMHSFWSPLSSFNYRLPTVANRTFTLFFCGISILNITASLLQQCLGETEGGTVQEEDPWHPIVQSGSRHRSHGSEISERVST